jgi:penicillin-binding protein 1A
MNLATIWLAQRIGMSPIQEIAKRLNIYDQIPPGLATVLGAAETNLLRLTTAYGILVNQGRKIEPQWINTVKDRRGKILSTNVSPLEALSESPLIIPGEQLVSPKLSFQMIRMLQKSVERGAAMRAQVPGQIVAGKTGTSNDYFDAWFIGFTPDLVVGVLVGFDSPQSLGNHQTGSAVAAPIFADFMKTVLKDKAPKTFEEPKESQTAWVDKVLPQESTPVEPLTASRTDLPGLMLISEEREG